MNDLAFGLDVGGTKVLAVAVDAAGLIVTSARADTPNAADGTVVVRTLIETMAKVGWEPGCPLGIGVPGMVDDRGVVHFSPNLPAIVGLDVAQLIIDASGHRPMLVNDANAAAWAEYRLGAGQGTNNMLMVTLGTGIGGAAVVAGELVTGANGFAGEIGHVVIAPHGIACPCGRQGCWERYASGAGLSRLAREAAHSGQLPTLTAASGGDPEMVRAEDVSAAAQSGDREAKAVFETLGWWVALGLANLVAAADPDCIVLGGGVSEAGDTLLEPVRRAFAQCCYGYDVRPAITIALAALGERAGATGAALLAREHGA